MAERFVRGWIVDLAALNAVPGTGAPSPEELLRGAEADLLMTLGRGDEEAGEELVLEALTEIVSGELDPKRAYRYARVSEVVLDWVGRRLDGHVAMGLTYYLPGRSLGCWEPVLAALEMPTFAKIWAVENMLFPFARGGAAPTPIQWPIRTVLNSRDLDAVSVEMKGPIDSRIQCLPAELLGENDDRLESTRDELCSGLTRLRGWVEQAIAADRELVLIMDGDQ